MNTVVTILNHVGFDVFGMIYSPEQLNLMNASLAVENNNPRQEA